MAKCLFFLCDFHSLEINRLFFERLQRHLVQLKTKRNKKFLESDN